MVAEVKRVLEMAVAVQVAVARVAAKVEAKEGMVRVGWSATVMVEAAKVVVTRAVEKRVVAM